MKKFKYYLVLAFSLTATVMLSQIEVYVSSVLDSTIKEYTEDGTYVGNFIEPFAGGLNRPQSLIFMNDGTAITTGFLNSQIKQYDGETGAFIGNFSSGYSLTFPTRMRIGTDNLIYVLQNDATINKVVRFDLNGNFVDEFTSVGIPGAVGMDWDDAGNLYVASFGGAVDGFVQKFDPSGNDLGVFIDSTILQGPTSIWFNNNGDLLVMDWADGIVRRFDSNGQYIDDFITGLMNPEGFAFLPNTTGNTLLIGDRGSDTVEHFDEFGNYIGVFTSGNNLEDPNAIVVRDPTLSVTDNKNDVVFVWPSVGRLFYFNNKNTMKLESVDIYNSHGQLIDSVNLLEEISWNASGYSEGVYIIVGTINGTRVTQKIVVKK